MSCTGCASTFGLLRSEHGCPRCGYSHCKKCLSEKAVNSEGKSINVCKKCASTVPINPRRELTTTLPERQGPARTCNPPGRSASLAAGSDQDAELRERFERLARDRKGSAATQTELEIRLARLKGKSFDEHVAQQKPMYSGPDNRTAAQRSADLLAQMREELALERRLARPDEVIAERLARLRSDEEHGKEVSKEFSSNAPLPVNEAPSVSELPHEDSSMDTSELDDVNVLLRKMQQETDAEAKRAMTDMMKDKEIREQLDRLNAERKSGKKADAHDESDSDEEAEKLQKMLMEEDELTERLKRLESPPDELGDFDSDFAKQKTAEEELPWCCICNEDATMRCMGCDGDLYCQQCFREGHDKFDLKDHRRVPYSGGKRS